VNGSALGKDNVSRWNTSKIVLLPDYVNIYKLASPFARGVPASI
jgi:hypothetical protein